MQQEKRRLERFDLKVSARIENADKKKEKEAFDLVTNNLCAGGAFFHTDQSLPVGTKVKVNLVLPLGGLRKLSASCDQANVRVTGTVIRIQPGGMAVCFNDDYSIRPRRGVGTSRNKKMSGSNGNAAM
jgi:hypothetical protein